MIDDFTFYLGTHETSWLRRVDVAVPLFVSHRRLEQRRHLPRAVTAWACDSGGFTEIGLHGADAFPDGAEPYVEALYRYRDEIGNLAFAAPQDWMAEPFMIERTGLSVDEHIDRTVANLLEIRSLAPDLPVVPVLQGWRLADYARCADAYTAAGVDLTAEPVVGIGSVCRRQHTAEIVELTAHFAAQGIHLHAFGAKTAGLPSLVEHVASADSLAWSYRARHAPPSAGCSHKTCSNCPHFALAWRSSLLARLTEPQLAIDYPTEGTSAA